MRSKSGLFGSCLLCFTAWEYSHDAKSLDARQGSPPPSRNHVKVGYFSCWWNSNKLWRVCRPPEGKKAESSWIGKISSRGCGRAGKETTWFQNEPQTISPRWSSLGQDRQKSATHDTWIAMCISGSLPGLTSGIWAGSCNPTWHSGQKTADSSWSS